MKNLFLSLILLLFFAFIASAQTTLSEHLEKNKYDMKLENGMLSGKGAELILNEANASQFFLIGESHGITEMPILTTALFRDFNKIGITISQSKRDRSPREE